ncbi:MAG: hypothetical protein A4E73_00152 [Syntrophaceae bacterium PtaU1.Bin231]|nr:MAG: hypothetical protein A4E73_00152 [Syntrophaceae bacterium PtaU1.Bin231]
MEDFEDLLRIFPVHIAAEIHAHHLVFRIPEIYHGGRIEEREVAGQVHFVVGILHVVEDVPVPLLAVPEAVFALPQRIFRQLAFGDVRVGGHNDPSELGVVEQRGMDVTPEGRPVLTDVYELRMGFTRFGDRLHGEQPRFARLLLRWGHDAVNRHADHLFRAVSEKLFYFTVSPFYFQIVQTDQKDAFRRRLHNGRLEVEHLFRFSGPGIQEVKHEQGHEAEREADQGHHARLDEQRPQRACQFQPAGRCARIPQVGGPHHDGGGRNRTVGGDNPAVPVHDAPPRRRLYRMFDKQFRKSCLFVNPHLGIAADEPGCSVGEDFGLGRETPGGVLVLDDEKSQRHQDDEGQVSQPGVP